MVRMVMRVQLQYKTSNALLILWFNTRPRTQLKWNRPAKDTKPTIRKICMISAAFSSAFPVFCELTLESVLATRTAPFAVMLSITTPRAMKVVKTRPGWMGEWYGM